MSSHEFPFRLEEAASTKLAEIQEVSRGGIEYAIMHNRVGNNSETFSQKGKILTFFA